MQPAACKAALLLGDKRLRFNMEIRRCKKQQMLRNCRQQRLNYAAFTELIDIILNRQDGATRGQLERVLAGMQLDSQQLVQQLSERQTLRGLIDCILSERCLTVVGKTALVQLLRSIVVHCPSDRLFLSQPLLSKHLVSSVQQVDPTDKHQLRYLIEVTRLLAKLEEYSLPRQLRAPRHSVFRAETYQVARSAGHYQELVELARSDLEMRIALLGNGFDMPLAEDSLRFLGRHLEEAQEETDLQLCCRLLTAIIKKCPLNLQPQLHSSVAMSTFLFVFIGRQASSRQLSLPSLQLIIELAQETRNRAQSLSFEMLSNIPLEFYCRCLHLNQDLRTQVIEMLGCTIESLKRARHESEQFNVQLTDVLLLRLNSAQQVCMCLLIVQNLTRNHGWLGIVEYLLARGLIASLAVCLRSLPVMKPEIEYLLTEVLANLLDYSESQDKPFVVVALDSHGLLDWFQNRLTTSHQHYIQEVLRQHEIMHE